MRSVPRLTALRSLLVAGALAFAAFAPAAKADDPPSCAANLQGIVSSQGSSNGHTDACPPRTGRPENHGTGRKVG
jgi:hypothetical protein